MDISYKDPPEECVMLVDQCIYARLDELRGYSENEKPEIMRLQQNRISRLIKEMYTPENDPYFEGREKVDRVRWDLMVEILNRKIIIMCPKVEIKALIS